MSLHALATLAREASNYDPQLVLIGPCQQSNEGFLRDLALQLGVADRLHLLAPEYSRAAMADAYQAADAVVVPSRSEALGLVVSEASSLHRLVIAAEVGGISEQIAHIRNGLPFRHGRDSAGSGAALADQVEWAMKIRLWLHASLSSARCTAKRCISDRDCRPAS